MQNNNSKTLLFSVIAFLTLCTIGFFILLGVFLSDNLKAEKITEPSKPKTANVNKAENNIPTDKIQVASVTEDDHIRGNTEAPITLIEF